MTISVCIATYKRLERLAAVMNDLTKQTLPAGEIIVVDNDSEGSAKTVVDEFVRNNTSNMLVRYEIQPLKNISLTRNRTVVLSSGEWLAFIDDDERAPPYWLERLVSVTSKHGADGVLGPVVPVLPEHASLWLKRGHFYDFPRMSTGTEVPRNRLRFGNVLLRASLVREIPGPFDPAYGITGGEDGDMLAKMAINGAKIIWCDEANVDEPVEQSRLSLQWLWRRALRGGQDFARHTLAGRYGKVSSLGRLKFIVQSSIQMLVAAMMTMLVWPFGRHHAAYWLLKLSANLGKLSFFLGWHYMEYA